MATQILGRITVNSLERSGTRVEVDEAKKGLDEGNWKDLEEVEKVVE